MLGIAKKIYRKVFIPSPPSEGAMIDLYIRNGRIPWSPGYHHFKWKMIRGYLNSPEILQSFRTGKLLAGFGLGVDDRIVEYPWIFEKLGGSHNRLLDAGSTFNFEEILDLEVIKKKELAIYTFFPEKHNFNERCVSYQYGDLRLLPYREDWFDEIVCQSTIEHIDMDNSMYGYDLKTVTSESSKSYEYMKVIFELKRTLKQGGKLLVTFPYGKFENHGFFQQFDAEMLKRITDQLEPFGEIGLTFFRYYRDGWRIVSQGDCDNTESYNPHTGIGKGDDGAAHSRGICGIEFKKHSNS